MKGLKVRDLQVEIRSGERRLVPVDGVGFEVAANECVALLGESGCGKSLTALALMRLLPEGADIAQGTAELDGIDMLALPEREMRRVRGGRLAMIFQEPMTSLNPVLTIGQQIEEALTAHGDASQPGIKHQARELMTAVGLPPERLAAYPFQLSGGQRQRALIAMMLAGDPEVLIADEPTTALDVTVQAQILALLKQLQQQRGMGLLLITHDLDVARDMADRVAVMYAGQIVEWASRETLYQSPFHPYTQRLFQVLPAISRRGQRLAQIPGNVPGPEVRLEGCRFSGRCLRVMDRCRQETPAWRQLSPDHGVRCHLADGVDPMAAPVAAPAPSETSASPSAGEGAAKATGPVLALQGLAVHFPVRTGLLRRTTDVVKAVDGVDLEVHQGETVALVGESGCGKTTLARAALRLLEPTSGRLELLGRDIRQLEGEALRRQRAAMQIVFQDPFSSLNPRMRVGEILEEGMRALRPELSGQQRAAGLARLLEQVGLPQDVVGRYPHEFSGGQRQRIAIARALAVGPALMVLDEPTSALDVSVQAQILNLLADLQRQQGLAYLFITHNLSVVGYLAHRVAVMYRGRLVETGPAAELLTRPGHPYTRLLLGSVPGRGLPETPASVPGGQAAAPGGGCAFAPRCPQMRRECLEEQPALRELAPGRQAACLFPLV